MTGRKKKRAGSGPKSRARTEIDPRFEAGMPLRREFIQQPQRFTGHEQRTSYLGAMGESATANFGRWLPELVDAIHGADALHLLSVIAMGSVYTSARVGADTEPGASFLQAHFEIIQALALGCPPDAARQKILSGPAIKRIQDLTVLASAAFHLRKLGELADATGVEDSRRLYLVEQARATTHVSRNWAYPDQMIRITRDLFAPLDAHLERRWGVTASGLIGMIVGIVTLVERRTNEFRARLRPAVRAKSVEGMCRRFVDAFPEAGQARELAATLRSTPLDAAKQDVLSLAALYFHDPFTITLDDWLNAYPGTSPGVAELGAVLDQWSLTFGGLANFDPERVFLGNPVWRRPLVRLSGQRYFAPHAGLLLTFMFDLLRSLTEGDDLLVQRYEERRAEYLEDSVADLFTRAFPDARAWRGSMWKDESGRQGENDLLIVVDRVALIVEAKSGHFRPAARRGGEKSLRGDVTKLRVEPAQQAARFAQLLRVSGPRITLGTAKGPPNEIDLADVERFVPLSVLLDPLGPLATQWITLRAAGYVSDDAPFAPTMALGELEVVLQTLGRETEKLHYLVRRGDLEMRVNYHADEMDLLAFYLQTGFNLGDDEFNPGFHLMLNGLSNESIDPYYNRRSIDSPLPRPRRRMTRWWSDLLDLVEAQRQRGWSLLGIELLHANEEEQEILERELRAKRKELRRRGTTDGFGPLVVLGTDPKHGRAPIVAIAYRTGDEQERDRIVAAAASAAAVVTATARAVVIGLDADSPRNPCNVISYHRVG